MSKNGHFSQIIKSENDKEKQKYLYSDKNFKNLITEYIYNDDGSYTYKTKKDLKMFDYDIKSYIFKYDQNNNVKEKIYYFDDNFENFYYKLEYKYTKNPDKYSIKRIWTKPYENCIMSSIVKYYNNDNYMAVAYNDNNFKELYRKTWGKINKKDEELRLRIYAKLEDGYFSIIEKLDKDNNKIYEKKYKFKGILARILYFFAK